MAFTRLSVITRRRQQMAYIGISWNYTGMHYLTMYTRRRQSVVMDTTSKKHHK